MRICASDIFLYTIYFLWLITSLTAQAAGEDKQLLRNKYEEHEFYSACRYRETDVIQGYLNKDEFDVNAEFVSGKTNNKGTGLYLAAQEGFEDIVKLLVQNGAKVNKPLEKNKDTPLHAASENGHEAIVQFLLDSGAKINETNIYNATPLFYASLNGYFGVVKILISFGADKTIEYDDGSSLPISPLAAAKKKCPSFLSRLIIFFKRRNNHDIEGGYPSIVKVLENTQEVQPVHFKNNSDSVNIHMNPFHSVKVADN